MSELEEPPTTQPDAEDIIEGFQKPKRKQTELQKKTTLENLAKGRAKLAEKKKMLKEEATKRTEELVLVKAEKITKEKENKVKKIKKVLNISPEPEKEPEKETESEPEIIVERVIRKPKKKRIVYREETDTDNTDVEEVLVRRRSSKRPSTTPTPLPSPPSPQQSKYKLHFV